MLMAEALNLKDENQSGLVRGMVEGSNPSGPAINTVQYRHIQGMQSIQSTREVLETLE